MKNKFFTLLLIALLLVSLPMAVSAAENDTFLIDDADLLTASEEAKLESRLEEISKTYGAQITIVTKTGISSRDIDDRIEELYDKYGYGYGENHDGVMLMVCMDIREYRVLCNGFANDAIDIDTISDAFVPYLSDGDYADAFHTFADECEYYINGHLNGFPFDVGGSLMIALIVGVVVGLIVAFVLKGQLNSVRPQNQASAYVKPGSMKLTQTGDFYLYRTLTRTPRPKSNSSGGSRSGGGRSVGGGRF
ncbi:MAG: TPM domain-containing protein [Ruminococcaceae bacterium]|nr:TPM domain-containing protein [Oscillospiraceae bacterium]